MTQAIARLEIERDLNPANPRTRPGNLGTMVCWYAYGKGILGDLRPMQSIDDYIEALPEDTFAVPVYMQVLGTNIYFSIVGGFSHQKPVGIYHAPIDKMKAEFGGDWPAREQEAIYKIGQEVSDYADYLNDQVFGYRAFDAQGNEIEAKTGFYGNCVVRNGIAMSLPAGARYLLDGACDRAHLNFDDQYLDEWVAHHAEEDARHAAAAMQRETPEPTAPSRRVPRV